MMNNEIDPLIGAQLGTYQVQGSLGEGGMARVYKAYHPRLRREVAIKVILSQVAASEGFRARFEREAQVIASLQHPNIVSVYDFGEEGNITYLVMQYVGGGTLRQQLGNGHPLGIAQAINYTIQMARALHHAHQHGIVHRDVKPQNMLVSSTDRNHLLLSDFGIAKLYGRDEDFSTAMAEMPTRSVGADPALTSADQVIGTADYMSPEQASGEKVDARTDVYALGIVLYQMLTGEVPFHSTTLRGLLFQHVYSPPPSVRARNPQVPEILAQIVSKALAKAPKDRFQTAEEMAQALEFARQGGAQIQGYPGGAGHPQAVSGQQTRMDSAPRSQDYATFPADVAIAGRTAVTPPSGISRPTTDPVLARGQLAPPAPTTRKRRLPLSYLIGAAVLILGLVVLGLHLYQNQAGSPTTTTTGPATAFNETFQDNSRGWPAGNLDHGITASVPGGGIYQVTLTQGFTAFPYPQKIGTLPANFTLSATIKQTSGDAAFYGIAFHFTESANNVSCYALIIINSGDYEIGKCSDINQGNGYQNKWYPLSSTQAHTLKVKAQGSKYSFYIDNTAATVAVGSQAASTTWSNSELQNGYLALFLSGGTSASATYQVSNVQLTLS